MKTRKFTIVVARKALLLKSIISLIKNNTCSTCQSSLPDHSDPACPLATQCCIQRVFVIITDKELKSSHHDLNKSSWTSVLDLHHQKLDYTNDQNHQHQGNTSLDTINVAERIYEAINCMPFTGAVLDVVVESSIIGILRSEEFLQIFGALRCLKDWHNAVITFVGDSSVTENWNVENHNQLATLQRLVSASQITGCENYNIAHDDVWRGKLSLVDKTINRGFSLPGFNVKGNPDYLKCAVSRDDDQVLGRMLEILDEVDIASIPSFYFTGKRLSLCLHELHPQSVSMMDLLCNSDTGAGCIARLAYYPDTANFPIMSETFLNSSSWKESVLSDISYVQEPEEELFYPHDFVYFLLTKKDNSTEPTVDLHLMRSSTQINGYISTYLCMKSKAPQKSCLSDSAVDSFFEGLPMMSSEILLLIDEIVRVEHQKYLGQQPEEYDNKMDAESESEGLSQILERVLTELRPILPVYTKSVEETGTAEDAAVRLRTELDLDTSEWPEKKYLLYLESQKKAINRLRSTDSLVLSSPIQPDEVSTPTLDIKHCLKLFRSDGRAQSQDLSPVRKKHSSRSKGKLAQNTDQQRLPGMSWPACQNQEGPDVYYNKHKKCEKVNEQCNKIRDRYVTDDTYSTCSSPIFVQPKKSTELGKHVEDMLPKTLRRSPRKSIKKSPKSSCVSSVRASPRVPKSKISPKGGLRQFSPGKKMTKQFASVLSQETKRRQSLSTLEIKNSSTDNLRRKSMTSVEVKGQNKRTGERRESRSERHKRKLEEIVLDVLKQNGIEDGNPIHKSCMQKLYRVTKLFVMDLPTSKNLKSEMRNIAEGQVKQVIDLEMRKLKK